MAITKVELERVSAASLRSQSGLWRARLTLDSLGAAFAAHTAVSLPRKFHKGSARIIAVHIPPQASSVPVGSATISNNGDTIALSTIGGPATAATNVVVEVTFEAQNP